MPFPRRKREPEPETDEAMRALPSDRWRAFVTFYLMAAPRRGAQTDAARSAGFGKPTSNDNYFQRQAHKLMADVRIQRAILAEARKMLRGAAPEAVNALLNVIRDPKHRDHMKGVDLLLSRTDVVETHSTVTHHVEIDHHREALDQLALMKRLGVSHDRLIEMFGYSGLGRYEAMLAERDKPKRVSGPAPEQPEPAGPDSRRGPPVIEAEAVEVKPPGQARDRW
jgi:hypothetical protein